MLGCTAALLVACGGSSRTAGYLSAHQSRTLSDDRAAAQRAISAHDCGSAARAVDAFDNYVASLPGNVSQTLVRNLGQGASTVKQLAEVDCTAPPPTPTPTSSSQSSASTTTTITTTTTTTTTTSSSSSPTSTSSSVSTSSSPTTQSSTSGFNGGHAPITPLPQGGG